MTALPQPPATAGCLSQETLLDPKTIDAATAAVLAQTYEYSPKHLARMKRENMRVWRETRQQISIALRAACHVAAQPLAAPCA